MSVMVEASGLVKSYGGRMVLDGLDLEVRQGEVLAIIGPNGAGKSTTLDLLLGLKRPDEGSVAYWRKDPRGRIGVQLQTTPFFPGFTALENMRMFAAFYGIRLRDADILDRLAECGLREAAGTNASRLSGGQQKRLAIAMALVHRPELLFLDEPTAALDPRARRDIRQFIQSLAEEGASVVFTSHDMEEVHKLASRVVLIRAGRVVAAGTPDGLLAESGAESLEELYIRMTEEELV